ncbi:metallophosphoesterase [Methylibium sp.]|uniref:metallophosphoesterase n=1 Tax=Methylibium sp. TaxID=2067992 RepID=UPI0017D90801|nr:metallophosphoesterase [Methylibium sp.]MBA3588855.1 metallophosphoesterase [Methylibium sp.]
MLRAARQAGVNTQAFTVSIDRAVAKGWVKQSERDRAATQHRAVKGNNDSEAALRKQIATLTAQVERMRNARPVVPVRIKTARVDDFVRVVIPDSHGTCIDPQAMGAFLDDLKALDPHEIVMLGDHVDCGGFLALHHTLGYVPETSYTYEDDISSANAFLDEIQRNAPHARIHYIEGNHEARVEKWCIAQTLRNGRESEGMRLRNAPEFLLRLKERGISYYRRAERYHDLPVPGTIKLGKTFFAHEPGRGGRPEQYAQRFGGCLIYGHEHRARGAVIRTVAAGEIGAWCPGTLAIQQPFYFHTNLTDHSHGHLVQIVAKSGGFLSINVPIINGVSHLRPLLDRGT